MADVTQTRSDRSPAFDAEALDHLGTLKALSRRLVRNQSEADDLVQDAYVRALRASRRFAPGTNLRAWLRTILINLVRNHRRDQWRSRIHSDEAELARAADVRSSGQSSPEQLLLNDVIGARVQTALEAMPKALRDAVWLRDVEGLSYAEIAARLRVPLGTVMSRISRGRRSLRDKLMAPDGPGAGA